MTIHEMAHRSHPPARVQSPSEHGVTDLTQPRHLRVIRDELVEQRLDQRQRPDAIHTVLRGHQRRSRLTSGRVPLLARCEARLRRVGGPARCPSPRACFDVLARLLQSTSR